MLEKLLKKLNAKTYLDLREEEKATYKSWEEALAGRRLTDEDVSNFLKNEVEKTILKLTSQKLGDREDIFLKMKLEFARNLQNFLNSPIIEKEAAEKQIELSLNS